MPSMPGYFVGKGYQFLMLDRQFGGSEDEYMAAYEAALGRIDQPLGELAAEHADGRSGLRDELQAGDASHFRKHWLGDWWPGKRVEEVLRAGYREAIRRAQEARKPIESLWVCAKEDRLGERRGRPEGQGRRRSTRPRRQGADRGPPPEVSTRSAGRVNRRRRAALSAPAPRRNLGG